MDSDYQLPKLTFATINCNSLNMSSIGNNNHLLKIYGITSLKTDIIFLSDIRMCNSSGISNLNELLTSLKINPHCSYRFYHNSKSNKRGVGILIKHSLSIAVLDETRDLNDNYLALHLEFEGKKFTVCSIYGPNQVQPTFFTSLQECVSNLGNYPIVMGGDWNCTISCEPAISNLDTLNMQKTPNLRHSALLKKMCSELNLADPFRDIFFPLALIHSSALCCEA
jgi:exonuclease III